jgi:ATP-dependent exoDNAse (exonuclease V) beta subunit
VVAALGSRNKVGRGEAFVAGKDGEVGLTLSGVDLKGDERPFCLGAVREIESQEQSRDAEERKRVLYVGMTRAEERLLVAVCVPPDPAKWPGTTAGQLLVALGVGSLPEREVLPMGGLDLRVVPAALVEPAAICRTAVGTGGPSSIAPAPPSFSLAGASPAVLRAASFSSLAAYARCPRGYYLEHVLGLRPEADDAWEPVLGEARPGGREIGLLVHRVLEKADLARRPGTDDLAALVSAAARDLGIDTGGPEVRRALELAGAFWDSPVAGEPGLSAARKECHFVFAQGEVLVSGVIDLLLEDGRCQHVVDYKTNRLDGRGAEEVLSGYRQQAQVYALAGLLQGAPSVTVSFLLLDAPETLHSRDYTQDDRPGLEARLAAMLRRVGEAGFPQVRDECARCRFAQLCAALAGDGLLGVDSGSLRPDDGVT